MSDRKNTYSRIDTRAPKRRLRNRIKLLLVIVVVLFLSVFGYGIYLYIKASTAMSGAYEEDLRDKSDLRDNYVDPKFDNVSILIMGVDESEQRSQKSGNVTRTDALIVATLNKDEKSVKLLSIPRDSYVYIPEVGYYDKINHAHVFGGTQGTIETVEQLLEIPIDYYVKLNFHAFIDVIDAIGGVEVEIPYEIKEMDSNDKKGKIHLLPGKHLLNGEEALALARTRKKDSDVHRGQRQLEIIDAVIKKATSFSSILKLDDVIEAVGNNMTTNLTFSEMQSFISYGTAGTNINVEKLTLEGSDYQPSNVYYYKLDEESLQQTKNTLKGHLDLPTFVEDDQSNSTNQYESAIPERQY